MLKIKNGYAYFLAKLLTGIDMTARTTLVKNKILTKIGIIEDNQLENQHRVVEENHAFIDGKGKIEYQSDATDADRESVKEELSKLANEETDLELTESELTTLRNFFSEWDGVVPADLSYVYGYLTSILNV